MNAEFDPPRQLLPRDAYFDPAWHAREQSALFDRAWVWAGPEAHLKEAGDFIACRMTRHSLFVVRDAQGELRAFHNLCRHRGCEVVEGRGNLGRAIRCPYHRWTYGLDGGLRAVPNEKACFGAAPRESLALHRAAVGAHRGMVYVNPQPRPPEPFERWIAGLDAHLWPHDLGDGSLRFVGESRHEMLCNWKVFYENAVDGYHLGYLHAATLGRLFPDRNLWRPVGRHAVWYSTEREGPPRAASVLVTELADRYRTTRLPGHETPLYPGVVMLFPLTIYTPSPWGFGVSLLEPEAPERTLLRTFEWAPAGGWEGVLRALRGALRAARRGGRKRRGGTSQPREDARVVRLADLREHPLDSGDFQLEDMWICEKIQRNLRSPLFRVGPMAKGAGAESPVTHFQRSVLDYVHGRAGEDRRVGSALPPLA